MYTYRKCLLQPINNLLSKVHNVNFHSCCMGDFEFPLCWVMCVLEELAELLAVNGGKRLVGGGNELGKEILEMALVPWLLSTNENERQGVGEYTTHLSGRSPLFKHITNIICELL